MIAVTCLVTGIPGLLAAQIVTTGSVQGIVVDADTGEPLPQATVVARSSVLQGVESVTADEAGNYYIPNLPPGLYVLTLYYEGGQLTLSNVLVRLGKITRVDLRFNTAGTAGEVIEIAGRAPLIDQGSAKTGVTITTDYTRNIPVGRTFTETLDLAPGAQADRFGTGFGGSTSPENSYVIEGFNVTGLVAGTATLTLPNDFLREIEIISGAYGAELGGATGGISNVLTKAGGNEFHGSVFGHITPGALAASAAFSPREGSAIDFQRNLGYEGDIGFEVGGPIVEDKLWFHVGFNPSFAEETADRVIQRFVDTDDDNAPDMAEELSRRRIDLPTQTYYFTSKLSFAATSEHRGSVAVIGNPSTNALLFDEFAIGPDETLLFDESQGVVSSIARWTSQFWDGDGQLEATFGLHLGRDIQDAMFDAGQAQAVRFLYPRALADFTDFEEVPAGCLSDDAEAPFLQCPVTNYQIGGIDIFNQAETQRIAGGLSYRHIVNVAGQHRLKAGIFVEDNRLDERAAFSGGTRWWDMGTAVARFRFNQPDASGNIPCGRDFDGDGVADTSCSSDPAGRFASVGTFNTGAFVEDSWLVLPNLTINAGLRFERQAVGTADQIQGDTDPITLETTAETAFTLNNLAPRVGAIYDWTREGRSRAFANWGRYYESVPLDLNARGFSGEILSIRFINPSACSNPFAPENYDCDEAETLFGVDLGGNKLVAPGVEGQYLDEIVAGVEYELASDLKIGATYIRRSLGRAIEDISPDGGDTLVIANPGEVDADAIAELRASAATARDNGDMAAANRLDFLARAYDAVGRFDRPQRDYNAVEVSVVKRFSDNLMARGSYTYAKLMGNYPGLFSPDTNQLDPNITSMYDLPELMANRAGDLPSDHPHQIKLDAYYSLPVSGVGTFVLGSRVRGASGRPSNVLGTHLIYGNNETFILPRGAGDRTPFATSIDAHLAYSRDLSRGMRMEIFVDAFNLFNLQSTTRYDETYTLDVVNPIVGGDENDLAHLKAIEGGTTTNRTVTVNPNYGRPSEYQNPLQVRLGARLSF